MSVSEPGKIITPWAESGLKNPIPPAANPATGRAGFDQGFSAINMTAKEAGGIPPFGQDFNGIFYDVTNILRYMQAGGQPTFDGALASAIGGYPKGAVIIGAGGGVCYQNQVDSNMNDPDVNSSGWLPIVANQYPVGAPIPWPTAVPPAGFLAMIGQSFSAATYPRLALAYPSGVLPDLRGEFIRGWDNNRGLTVNSLLGVQGQTIQSHNHSVPIQSGSISTVGENRGARMDVGGSVQSGNSGSEETRPRNVTFNYIVRTA